MGHTHRSQIWVQTGDAFWQLQVRNLLDYVLQVRNLLTINYKLELTMYYYCLWYDKLWGPSQRVVTLLERFKIIFQRILFASTSRQLQVLENFLTFGHSDIPVNFPHCIAKTDLEDEAGNHIFSLGPNWARAEPFSFDAHGSLSFTTEKWLK